MRRHESLILLSRDHHQGLIIARRLQRGRRSPTDTAWPSDPQAQARRVVEFYQSELIHHFEAEEKVLFPAVRPYLKPTEEIVDDLLRQHRRMRHAVEEFGTGNMKELKARLHDLGQLLAEHIRLEEDKLFPLCEKRIPSEVLGRVGKEIEEAHHAARCKTPRRPQH